ncbi:MAG: hypothetical protein ACQETL_18385 [Bacteroidota bacterium]
MEEILEAFLIYFQDELKSYKNPYICIGLINLIMKQITLNIPDDKYQFFIELIDNLGLQEVVNKDISYKKTADKENKKDGNSASTLRGKLKINNNQLNDFQKHVKNSREKWQRDI